MHKRIITLLILSLMAIPAFAKDAPEAHEVNTDRFATKWTAAHEKIKSIDTSILKLWIDQKKDFMLLDVREDNEVTAAKIAADNYAAVPRGVVEFLFPNKIKNDDTLIVVYCLVGNRSAIVTDILTTHGYKNVYNLNNGIMGWIKAGHPVSNFFGSFKMTDFKSTF